MGRKSVAVLPQTQAILEQLGEQIKLARLRRHLSAELVAERAGVSRATVWNVDQTKKQFMSMRASNLQSQTSWGRSSWRMSVAGRATHLSMMLTG